MSANNVEKSLRVGSLVVNATANSVLIIDSSGNLAQDPDFTYNPTTNALTIAGPMYVQSAIGVEIGPDGANISYESATGSFVLTGNLSSGALIITANDAVANAIFNIASLTDDRTFTFPNKSGTFALTSVSGAAFTAGSVIFADSSGNLAQDNANFFWDDTLNNLGVGTASPTERVHAYRNDSTNAIIKIENDNTSGNAAFVADAPTSGAARPFIAFHDGGTSKADIGLERTTSQILGGTRNDLYITTTASGNILFGINSVEKMRLDTSGRLLINTTTAVEELTLAGDGHTSGYWQFTELSTPTTPDADRGRLYVKDDGSGTSALFFLDDAGTEVQLGGGGGGGATTFLALTDTPDTYASQALKVVAVNSAETALEFITTVPVAQGGTNIASYTAGDLIYASASTTLSKLAIGTSGLFLQSSGTAPQWVGAVDLTTNQTISSGIKTFTVLPQSSAVPATGNDLTNKTYVDAFALGTIYKEAVRVATTTAGTLASDFENGDTIDGVVLATGDRILIKNQADATTNGIYTVNASGAPTRATDYDTTAEVQEGTATFATAGTVNQDKLFAQNTIDPVLGSSNLVFVQIGKAPSYTASLGVELVSLDFRADLLSTGAIGLTGNELKVNVDSSSIEISSNALQVKALGITNAMLAGSIADSKLSTITTAGKVDGSAIENLNNIPGTSKVPTDNLGTGTADSTTFLRGDQSWAVPSGTGSGAVTISYSELLNTDTTAVTITNSAVETTIYTYTLTANTLGTDKAVALKLFGSYRQFSSQNRQVRVRVKLGATTLMDATSANIGSNTNTGYWGGEVFLQNTGATNEQHAFMRFTFERGGTAAGASSSDVSVVDRSVGAVDTTADQDLVVTVQLSSANATQTFVRQGAVLNMLNSSDTLGAPTNASYVTLAAHADLTNERVLTAGNGINLTDNGAGSTIVVAADSASDTVDGIIEIAVQSEMETGTSTTLAVVPGRQHYHPGHPKCWAYVTVSGGTPTLQTSYNITSITDTSVGVLTITIATDFSTANWASPASAEDSSGTQVRSCAPNGKAAGSVILNSVVIDNLAQLALSDPSGWNLAGFGDQT